jgi:hypothetical protein
VLLASPFAPEERVEVPLAEPVDRGGHLRLERETAHLTVREDVKPDLLLEPEGLVDRPVLDPLELRGRQRAAFEPFPRREQVRRTEEAADDVGPEVGHENDSSRVVPVSIRRHPVSTMRDILVLCPQERDRKAVAAAGLDRTHRVRFAGRDLDELESFDPEAFLAECETLPADGVVGTKDQSALLASILADRRELPGPDPESLLACQHKPTSREIQRRVAPESTPRFAILDGRLPFEPPFFVKPVVGRLSQKAVRIERAADLGRLNGPDGYARRYGRIAALAGAPADRAHGFLAEDLLSGLEVTLEGYVRRGRVTTIGVTDSVKYPGTISFERFEYPSRLTDDRTADLAALAERLVAAHGLDDAFFNVEFFVPDEGPPEIIELNGRLASQFAPLVHRLHGRSTYDALFALACGEDPAWASGTPGGVGVSYVLRVFADALVEAVPEPEDDLEILVRPGVPLSEQGLNDAQSYRLAILYGFGETREEAVERCRARARDLTFRLAPLPVR